MKHNIFTVLATFIAIFLSGCATIPRDTYRGTASGYNQAMQEVLQEQLLLNIVRLRYRDTPYFFETSSITAQFDLSTGAGVAGTFPLTSDGTNVLSGNAGVNFSERPTISYTPLKGEDFYKRLLESFSFSKMVLLTNSGWSMDTVARLMIQRANGLPNAIGASGPTPSVVSESETFQIVASDLFTLQRTGLIELGEAEQEGDMKSVIFLPESGQNEAADRIRDMFTLDPGRTYYFVRHGIGVSRSGGDTIEINTRSLLGVMFYLSLGVNVPRSHMEAGFVTRTLDHAGEEYDWNQTLDGLFRVESSSSRPRDAATAIRYRGNWFYIKDNDLSSKSTFMLLTQMFALQTGDTKSQIPVLTIPVGN